MNTLTLVVLGLGLSVDAFAAALGKGATSSARGFVPALKTGLWFGGFEALAPAVGGLAGFALASWITAIDHWVAFGLLALVGGHMILESRKPDNSAEEKSDKPTSPARMILTAMATSIDSAAVGISLSLLQVNLLQACLIIGLVCTCVATSGVMLGHKVGPHLGKYAELLGGLVLLAIGTQILVEHTLFS